MAGGTREQPDAEVRTLDSDGLMVPPWVKFPNLPAVPVGWWRGDQTYRADFREWWELQSREIRERLQACYPEPVTWEGFYGIVGRGSPELDRETRTIYKLVAALLSDALWRRAKEEPGFSVLGHLMRSPEEYCPESTEEIAIWDELTQPRHYQSLLRYVEQYHARNDDHYQRFLVVLRDAARQRCETVGGYEQLDQ